MGGFFGTISNKSCKTDLFYGTDYNSHLGTKRGGMATFSTVRQLRRTNPSLAEAFTLVTEGHEEKAGCTSEASTMTFSITASSAELRGKRVKIVAFNDISSDIEEYFA